MDIVLHSGVFDLKHETLLFVSPYSIAGDVTKAHFCDKYYILSLPNWPSLPLSLTPVLSALDSFLTGSLVVPGACAASNALSACLGDGKVSYRSVRRRHTGRQRLWRLPHAASSCPIQRAFQLLSPQPQ